LAQTSDGDKCSEARERTASKALGALSDDAGAVTTSQKALGTLSDDAGSVTTASKALGALSDTRIATTAQKALAALAVAQRHIRRKRHAE
jgi:hypothetical protein